MKFVIRAIAPFVVSAALATSLPAFDLGDMTPAEREAFGDAVRDYLLENPQVIMDAVAVLEQRQAQEQATADLTLVSDNQAALFEDGYSFVGGNPDGDITMVEFLDYRCGYCRRAHPEVAKLLSDDGNIRLIVKEFPILGEQSLLASRFAVSVKQIAGNDAYKLASDSLIAFSGEITPQSLGRIASSLGLDMDEIAVQMQSDDVTRELTATRELAQKMRITGTPTFVLDDELLRGYLPYDQLKAIVAEKRG